MTEYRWVLPSVLLGDGSDGRPAKRSTRDWIVDTVMFLAACGLTYLSLSDLAGDPRPLQMIEQVAGALSCAAVWLRRRWPFGLALVTTVVSSFLMLVGGAAVVGLFTVAVHRPFKFSGPIVLLSLVTLVPYVMLRPDRELGFWGAIVLGVAIVLTVFAWGVVVRARRQLVWSLRQRADIAAEEAKRLERERIAREMHDVLAHRLSMLSLHAGALEFRPDASSGEIARAAGAIRDSAHQALQDLREVIGVLRHPGADPDSPVPDRPQPTLGDLPALVEECGHAGMDVTLSTPGFDVPLATSAGGERRPAADPDVPQGLGRNVYRIVQEALTNARKHAGGAPVTVTVTGGQDDGVTVEVRNPLGGRQPMRLPGAGAGLIGLNERAELAGGRLQHGKTAEGDFLLRAWLPWTP
ncbi:histidine kinase [Nonomuraea sp. NPDC000554]|uniref:sensor histidine kinase n=1 Tax=Nonomuraea sp. NPDC000554 TaxID=3154259 RepID=UPI003318EA4E